MRDQLDSLAQTTAVPLRSVRLIAHAAPQEPTYGSRIKTSIHKACHAPVSLMNGILAVQLLFVFTTSKALITYLKAFRTMSSGKYEQNAEVQRTVSLAPLGHMAPITKQMKTITVTGQHRQRGYLIVKIFCDVDHGRVLFY